MTAESSDPEAFSRNADAFLAHALSAFGPERTMIGSDWPVSATFGIGGTFVDWITRVRRLVERAGLARGCGRHCPTCLRGTHVTPNGRVLVVAWPHPQFAGT